MTLKLRLGLLFKCVAVVAGKVYGSVFDGCNNHRVQASSLFFSSYSLKTHNNNNEKTYNSCKIHEYRHSRKDSCPRYNNGRRRSLNNFLLLLILNALKPWRENAFMALTIPSAVSRIFGDVICAFLWLHMHARIHTELISVLLSPCSLPAQPRETESLHGEFFPFALMHVSLMLQPLKGRECYLRVLLLLALFVLWHSGRYSPSSLHTAAVPRLAW